MSIQACLRSRSHVLLLSCLTLGLSGCSGGSGGGRAFEVANTSGSVMAGATIVVRGSLGVYLSSEAVANADLNLDGDQVDTVARVVRLDGNVDLISGVATESVEILGSNVFLEVLEANDGNDWNLDAVQNDRVLLHYDVASETLTFVDTLLPGTRGSAMLLAGGRLYYSAEVMGLMGDESTLRYLALGAPMTPVAIDNSVGDGTLSPTLLGEDEGLIFMLLDETVEGRSLNSDVDFLDDSVLALLDGNVIGAPIKNTQLAMLDENEPFDAELTGVNDWTVAFLVSEAAEGGVSMNDFNTFTNPIVVASCTTGDLDANDRLLHYIEFASFMTGASLPVNTGLTGRDRVIAVNGAVATLSFEFDALCDLNEDGDFNDRIARWTTTVTPVMPSVTVAEMHAIETTINGGSMGLSSLGNRLVGVVDELGDSRNLDQRGDNDVVGWVDPTLGASAVWTFRHQSNSNPNIGTGIFEDTTGDGIGDPGLGASEPFAGADWMAAEETFGRLGITFQERVPGSNPQVPSLNTNLRCGFFRKDMDLADSLPVWLDFEAGPILDFDGVGFAVDPVNAGVSTQTNTAFFVVDEAFDNFDHNDDGDFADKLLFRNPTNQCQPILMSGLVSGASVIGPVIHTDGLNGAMFIASEAADGEDLNGDNDALDFVVRYFRF